MKKFDLPLISGPGLVPSYLLVSPDIDLAYQQIENLSKNLSISSADTFILESKEKIKISDIRELQRMINFKPHSSQFKLAVIKQAENLTAEAANALLKTLEEPPAHSLIILIASHKEALLATIVSRCQIIRNNNLFTLSEESYQDVEKEINLIKSLAVAEKFKYVEELLRKEDLIAKLTQWLWYFKSQILDDSSITNILKKIQRTQQLLSQSNVNKKLLLENLLMII